jgi:hypothetical protein
VQQSDRAAKKATIWLGEATARALAVAAAETGQKQSAIVEAALTEWLAARKKSA